MLSIRCFQWFNSTIHLVHLGCALYIVRSPNVFSYIFAKPPPSYNIFCAIYYFLFLRWFRVWVSDVVTQFIPSLAYILFKGAFYWWHSVDFFLNLLMKSMHCENRLHVTFVYNCKYANTIVIFLLPPHILQSSCLGNHHLDFLFFIWKKMNIRLLDVVGGQWRLGWCLQRALPLWRNCFKCR